MPQIAVIPSEVEESPDPGFKVTPRDPSTSLGMTILKLTPENDEDTGEKSDDSWNKAEVKSKYCNQANKNQINREQQHSDIFVKGHDSSMEQGAWSVEWEPPPCSLLLAPLLLVTAPSIRERISLAGCQRK
jgi:hypothetical protein